MSDPADVPIALALSGGGIRAMVFHLGVLRRLAERGLLERVTKVSTVSGGSLLIGLILQENNLAWPQSDQFLQTTLPALKQKLCASSLQWGAGRRLLNPLNLRFILSRANLLALCLKKEWGVSSSLSALPESPEWSINGTTAENGKRFRFKRGDIGDYTLGYAAGSDFPLANAMAVSAAFPGGFGPLKLDARRFVWRKRPWDAPVQDAQQVQPDFDSLHLYDGGVYDNLGLEPFFDAGTLRPKFGGHHLIVSDAGAPLPKGFGYWLLSPFRFKRVVDIMGDQARALRVRGFIGYLRTSKDAGAYVYIDTPVKDGTGADSTKFVAGFPTTLRRLKPAEFEQILEHGYAVAMRVEQEFGLYGAGPGRRPSEQST
ncbi:NTE family protein [Pelomonas aquatica]|uniref:NTE family protein n=1 Tax=Pelomonas aquatica TaxID=431058 RepID=A0ABU1Z6W0_9BURK|nr:patatin-like phospholipase family protein [Pelomonas aquatica]MDR7296342.1 NTE family protein [Pelomonas aquatica]